MKDYSNYKLKKTIEKICPDLEIIAGCLVMFADQLDVKKKYMKRRNMTPWDAERCYKKLVHASENLNKFGYNIKILPFDEAIEKLDRIREEELMK
jgi:hypothetical protein